MSSAAPPVPPRRILTAASRLRQDYLRLKRDPLPFITAEPNPENMLEWHYVIMGPPDSPFEGGYYHGMLWFTREYPFKPPSIYMLTPNGRFRTNTRLCLSISDYHPDTWNPTWCVGSILTGLLSFMLEDTPTYGAIDSSTYQKKIYARNSLIFNLRSEIFCELFPEHREEIEKKLEEDPPTNYIRNVACCTSDNDDEPTADKAIAVNIMPDEKDDVVKIDASTNTCKCLSEDADIHTCTCDSIPSEWSTLMMNFVASVALFIFGLVVHAIFRNEGQENRKN